jgi:hypothetical protein
MIQAPPGASVDSPSGRPGTTRGKVSTEDNLLTIDDEPRVCNGAKKSASWLWGKSAKYTYMYLSV